MQRRIMTLIAFSLLAAPATGFAQVRTPPTPRPPAAAAMPGVPGVEIANQILAHREELGLTEDQVTRIRTLRDQHVATLRPIAEQLRAQRPDSQRANTMRDRMQEQRDRMQQRRDSVRTRPGTTRQDSIRTRTGTTGTRTDSIRTRTGTTGTRQDSMRTRTGTTGTRQDSMRTRPATPRDTVRTRTPRGGVRADPQAMPALRAQMEELRETNREFVAQISAVLTPAQRQKLSELRARRGPGGR